MVDFEGVFNGQASNPVIFSFPKKFRFNCASRVTFTAYVLSRYLKKHWTSSHRFDVSSLDIRGYLLLFYPLIISTGVSVCWSRAREARFLSIIKLFKLFRRRS